MHDARVSKPTARKVNEVVRLQLPEHWFWLDILGVGPHQVNLKDVFQMCQAQVPTHQEQRGITRACRDRTLCMCLAARLPEGQLPTPRRGSFKGKPEDIVPLKPGLLTNSEGAGSHVASTYSIKTRENNAVYNLRARLWLSSASCSGFTLAATCGLALRDPVLWEL